MFVGICLSYHWSKKKNPCCLLVVPCLVHLTSVFFSFCASGDLNHIPVHIFTFVFQSHGGDIMWVHSRVRQRKSVLKRNCSTIKEEAIRTNRQREEKRGERERERRSNEENQRGRERKHDCKPKGHLKVSSAFLATLPIHMSYPRTHPSLSLMHCPVRNYWNIIHNTMWRLVYTWKYYKM